MSRPKRIPTCHPNRPHAAFGFCKPCYDRNYVYPSGKHTMRQLTGERFGLLKVVSQVLPHKPRNGRKWNCDCDCGGKTVATTGALISGDNKSCGCLKLRKYRTDLTGLRFTRWTVGAFDQKQGRWDCRCDCGKRHLVRTTQLTRGRSRSCGCLNKRPDSMKNKHRSLYIACQGAIARCNRKTHAGFKHYGAIGISVAWKSPTRMTAWIIENLGPRPQINGDRYTLDRIDPYGNYEPGNLRWATYKTQANNHRRKLISQFSAKQLMDQLKKLANGHRALVLMKHIYN